MVAMFDAAVGVVHHDQVRPGANLPARRLRYRAQDLNRFEQCRIDATTDVADDGGLARLQLEDVHRIDAGIDAAKDERLTRRHHLQVRIESAISEFGVTAHQGFESVHDILQ